MVEALSPTGSYGKVGVDGYAGLLSEILTPDIPGGQNADLGSPAGFRTSSVMSWAILEGFLRFPETSQTPGVYNFQKLECVSSNCSPASSHCTHAHKNIMIT